MSTRLPHAELLQLKRWNTPTIYNGWEQITRHDASAAGFNLEETRDFMPQMGPMVGFFNDVDVCSGEASVAAVEYFGTKGFFNDYDARVGEGLKYATAEVWVRALAKIGDVKEERNSLARSVAEAERSERVISEGEFVGLLKGGVVSGAKEAAAISRGAALRMMWERKGIQ